MDQSDVTARADTFVADPKVRTAALVDLDAVELETIELFLKLLGWHCARCVGEHELQACDPSLVIFAARNAIGINAILGMFENKQIAFAMTVNHYQADFARDAGQAGITCMMLPLDLAELEQLAYSAA